MCSSRHVFARALGLSLCLTSLSLPAFADRGATAQLPDAAQIAAAASPEFLHALVMANITSTNCPGHALSDDEWALITGTADRVAAALNIDNRSFNDNYYSPAFAALDQAGTCDSEGAKIAPLIKRLRKMGGSADPIG
ncbi:hypothetical protein Q9295_08650 [Xinfangfangia sp. CPCC 101601]|uniref:DUF732 domain-containing protein n=1 Tax=Pseudogemmobacter lacusdianii TaxID=3069608 RepID=A0ABU0VXF6_9RHOB|nr:hypothetical protein [Xinfangfangia sp. CPCC 101601]MDQ2066440.1 hypothetical protein [Xinfangfangia sp. CPCC 101601]